MALSLQEAFSSLEDPRVERHKRHMLIDIIVLTICAVISGADGCEAIEQFAKNKQDWLRKWLDLENGIPSHDCIARVIAGIPSAEMTDCFIAWTSTSCRKNLVDWADCEFFDRIISHACR